MAAGVMYAAKYELAQFEPSQHQINILTYCKPCLAIRAGHIAMSHLCDRVNRVERSMCLYFPRFLSGIRSFVGADVSHRYLQLFQQNVIIQSLLILTSTLSSRSWSDRKFLRQGIRSQSSAYHLENASMKVSGSNHKITHAGLSMYVCQTMMTSKGGSSVSSQVRSLPPCITFTHRVNLA